MNNIIFKPWIGKNYGKSSLGKLLIIGESHYDRNGLTDFADFTIEILSELSGSSDNNFFIEVGKLFNPENHLEVWANVAFANAIQNVYPQSRSPKNSQQIKTIAPAIKEYLKITKPDKMLVCSSLVWNQGLPSSIEWGEYVSSIDDEIHMKKSTIWKFETGDKPCLAMGIHHPGSTNPKFKVSEWSPLVWKFLNNRY